MTPHDEFAALAERVSVAKGGIVFRAGEPADAIYEIADGIVKTYSPLPDGGTCITAFLFPGDLFGVAENGCYIHSAAALRLTHLLSVKNARLLPLLHCSAEVDLFLLCKLSHELREAERHELLLARKDSVGRLVMFFAMLQRAARAQGASTEILALPMRRGDIAEYLAITREALSRAAGKLRAAGCVAYPDLRHVRITDAAALQALAAKEGGSHRSRAPPRSRVAPPHA